MIKLKEILKEAKQILNEDDKSLAWLLHLEYDAFNKLEVFVNGQLLTSGAVAIAKASPSSGDYAIMSKAAGVLSQQISASFAFDLEADDVITLIRKL